MLKGFAMGTFTSERDGGACCVRPILSLWKELTSLGLKVPLVLMDEVELSGAGEEATACFRFPLENQEVEDDGIFEALEVVDVTEDIRDNPIFGILLFSRSFSPPLVELEPCVPREAILLDVLRIKERIWWKARTCVLHIDVSENEQCMGARESGTAKTA